MTTYLWSKRRCAGAMFVLLFAAATVEMFVLYVIATLLVGNPVRPAALWWAPGQALACAIGGTVGTMLVFLRQPPWLRLGQAGVEMAPEAADAVFIPWAAVSSSDVRGRWYFKKLVVTSNTPEQVLWLSRHSLRVREQPHHGVITFKLRLIGMRGGQPAAFANRGPVDLRTLLPVLSP